MSTSPKKLGFFNLPLDLGGHLPLHDFSSCPTKEGTRAPYYLKKQRSDPNWTEQRKHNSNTTSDDRQPDQHEE